MRVNADFITEIMRAALEQAEVALKLGEVPVGAAVGYRGKLLATAHNEMEANRDATSHAEMLVIRRASEKIKDWRLVDTLLCVTLEPCTMCAGAIRQARIPVVVFGAADPRMGAFGSIYDLSQDSRLGPPVRVISGVESDACLQLLQEFFKQVRLAGKDRQ